MSYALKNKSQTFLTPKLKAVRGRMKDNKIIGWFLKYVPSPGFPTINESWLKDQYFSSQNGTTEMKL